MAHVTLLESAVTCNPNTEVSTDLGCIPNDPFAFVAKFYGIGPGLIGGVAFLSSFDCNLF